MEKKIHIENNTVQETLIIPLFARAVCSRHYPHLFNDEEAEKICERLDYDFSSREKLMNSTAGLFGALEVAQRHNDLLYEIREYLKQYPESAVVNLGCGLDDSFRKADNGKCHAYNIDFKDVIDIRDQIMGRSEREENIACDLTDHSWFDRIDGSKGAIFFASGVFYYIHKEEVKKLSDALAKHFPSGVLVFDSCNHIGAKMMTKTWLKEAGITDVSALFSLEDEKQIGGWSDHFRSVSARSYMRGYQDIWNDVSFAHKILLWFCDHIVKMKIIRIEFGGHL